MATKKPSQKPDMSEIASIARDFNKVTFGTILRNDDDTLLTRGGGKGLKIYDELERDCHAFAVLNKRKLAVISRPWAVQPASEDARDVAAGDLVRTAIEGIKFDRICLDLLDATLKGFAVGEVMWEMRDGYILPRDVLPRDQRRFVMDIDGQTRLLTREQMQQGIELPPRKFIVHRVGAKDGNPYGQGLGSRLFWPVMFKRQGITFWTIFADKFGSPTAVGKYPTGTTKADRDLLLQALKAISQDAGITIPEGMVVELLEASRSGSVDTYEKFVRYMDEQISKGVLGETMSTTASAAGLGSGQANVQNEVRLEISKADADLLSSTLRETLVQWIVDINMPGAGVPSVYRDFTDDDTERINAFTIGIDRLVSMGVRIPSKWVHDRFEIPEAGPDEETLTASGSTITWAEPPATRTKAAPQRQEPGAVEGQPTADDETAFAEPTTSEQAYRRAAQEAVIDAAESLSEE